MKRSKLLSLAASLMIAVSSFSFISNADESTEIIQIVGRDRMETSVLAAKEHGVDENTTLVLVNGNKFADSLSATNLLNKLPNTCLMEVTGSENYVKGSGAKHISFYLNRFGMKFKKIYVVGGEKTISEDYKNELNKFVKNESDIERLAGANRYETNKSILEKTGYKEVGVATGENYPDALSATGLLSEKNMGLMLVDGKKNYDTTYVVKYTFGGKNSVVKDAGERIAGQNRYETSVNIKKHIKNVRKAIVTSGKNFADALSSVNIINKEKGYAILLADSELTKEQKEALKGIKKIYIIGGNVKGSLMYDIMDVTNLKKVRVKSLTQENIYNLGDFKKVENKKVNLKAENTIEKITDKNNLIDIYIPKKDMNEHIYCKKDDDILSFRSKNTGDEMYVITVPSEKPTHPRYMYPGNIIKNGKKYYVIVEATRIHSFYSVINKKAFIDDMRALERVFNNGGIRAHKGAKYEKFNFKFDFSDILVDSLKNY